MNRCEREVLSEACETDSVRLSPVVTREAVCKSDGVIRFSHQASKRFACPKPNDISQGLNSIDQRSISDYVHSSEFLPDHQSGRTNDNHHVSPQNKDLTKFHLNESKKPSLLNRITLPLQDNDQNV
ncbi:hypothetical protein Pst134EB_002210 [Puccinia striiformis f. sp. tritici]|nr:hypothetical protein Pst134EB_002210 [Puccinia striiformis f. sp. tritici]